MSNSENTINKSTIDCYLNDLSKEIKKEFGRKARLELIIVGNVTD
jgi:hypothetical protein